MTLVLTPEKKRDYVQLADVTAAKIVEEGSRFKVRVHNRIYPCQCSWFALPAIMQNFWGRLLEGGGGNTCYNF